MERNDDEVGRDTGNEEGNGELAKAKDRESRGPNLKNASKCKRRLQGRGSGNKMRQGEHRNRRAKAKDRESRAGRGERDARASRDSRNGEAGTKRGKAGTGEHMCATTAEGQQSPKDEDSSNTGNGTGKRRRNTQDRDTGNKGSTRNSSAEEQGAGLGEKV